jgi:hypothetical protein
LVVEKDIIIIIIIITNHRITKPYRERYKRLCPKTSGHVRDRKRVASSTSLIVPLQNRNGWYGYNYLYSKAFRGLAHPQGCSRDLP